MKNFFLLAKLSLFWCNLRLFYTLCCHFSLGRILSKVSFYPVNWVKTDAHIQAMGSQFLQENAVGGTGTLGGWHSLPCLPQSLPAESSHACRKLPACTSLSFPFLPSLLSPAPSTIQAVNQPGLKPACKRGGWFGLIMSCGAAFCSDACNGVEPRQCVGVALAT